MGLWPINLEALYCTYKGFSLQSKFFLVLDVALDRASSKLNYTTLELLFNVKYSV